MTIRVSELNRITEKLIQEGLGDRLIVLSSDPEGNDFHTLEAYGTSLWDTEYREIFREEEDDYDEEYEYEPANTDNVEEVLVLWP